MRAHQLAGDGTILNTIMVDALDSMPGMTLVDASIGGSIGDKIVDGVLIPKASPDPVVPIQVDRLQARLALLSAGKWAMIQPAIDAMSDPTKSIAQAYFDDARYWHRHDTFVVLLAPVIGLSDADVDALFIAASQL